MKIIFTTEYGSNYQAIADVTTPVMKEYCDRHGYEFRPLLLEGTGNEYYYKKNEYFKELFKEYVDAIFYLDADAIITNLNIKLESFIDDEHSFFITEHLGELNGGALIIKNDFAGKIINEIILLFRDDFDNEQNVINAHFSSDNWSSLIKVVPHPAFNSLDYSLYPETPHIRNPEQGHWQPGQFVLHVPGLGTNHRLEILKNTPIQR